MEGGAPLVCALQSAPLVLKFDAYVLNSCRTRWHLQLLVQIEEEKRLNAELQDLLDKTQLKLKQYKRQVDEAVRAMRLWHHNRSRFVCSLH